MIGISPVPGGGFSSAHPRARVLACGRLPGAAWQPGGGNPGARALGLGEAVRWRAKRLMVDGPTKLRRRSLITFKNFAKINLY